MSDNDLYLQYVDEIVEQLNQKKAKTRDDIQEYFDYLIVDIKNIMEHIATTEEKVVKHI